MMNRSTTLHQCTLFYGSTITFVPGAAVPKARNKVPVPGTWYLVQYIQYYSTYGIGVFPGRTVQHVFCRRNADVRIVLPVVHYSKRSGETFIILVVEE